MLKVILTSGILLFLFIVPTLSEMDSIRKLILLTMKEKCLNVTDDVDMYADIHSELGDTFHCINELFDVHAIQRDFDKTIGRGIVLQQLFNKYCNIFDDALHCLDGLSMSLDNCLLTYEIGQKDHLLRGLDRWKSYLCEEEGAMLSHFYTGGGQECINKNQNKIKDCFQVVFPSRGYREMKLFIPQEEQCEDLESVKECVEPILDNCENKAAYDFIMESLNVFWDEYSCESGVAKTRISFITGILCVFFWFSMIFYKL